MQRLRKLGCGVALDDFGTGLSSLSYLTLHAGVDAQDRRQLRARHPARRTRRVDGARHRAAGARHEHHHRGRIRRDRGDPHARALARASTTARDSPSRARCRWARCSMSCVLAASEPSGTSWRTPAERAGKIRATAAGYGYHAPMNPSRRTSCSLAALRLPRGRRRIAARRRSRSSRHGRRRAQTPSRRRMPRSSPKSWSACSASTSTRSTTPSSVDDALRGLVGGLDPYSSYLEPRNTPICASAPPATYAGIGIEVIDRGSGAARGRPFRDSPAAAAGIQQRRHDLLRSTASRVRQRPRRGHGAHARTARARS